MRKTILLLCVAYQINFVHGGILKIMNYNLYGMKPGTEPEVRIVHIIDNIIEIDPDVIGLQEVCSSINSGEADNQAKVIADSLSKYFGIPYYYYTQFTHLSWNNQFREHIGIITKHPVEEEGFFQLVTGVFPRKVIWNKINTPLGKVNIFNTHLSYNSSSVRTQQVKQIVSFIERIEQSHPTIASILTGDFNETPNTIPIQQLTNTGTETFYIISYEFVNPTDMGYTVPSNAPTSKIDYIFLKNTSSIEPFESVLVMNQPYSGNKFCSDHLGILTSFTVNNTTSKADFTAFPTSGSNPLLVQFSDKSNGNIANYLWDFGDGDTSSIQNPVHTYETADTFSVTLTVTGEGGTDTQTKENMIIVNEPSPVAEFTVDSTFGMTPLTVQFTDQSTGVISSRLWEFGDGSSSNETNPTHIYDIADTFTVCLTVIGPGGEDTCEKLDYIIVGQATDVTSINGKPTAFKLRANYPNPFNPETKISFSVPQKSQVNISIYDINGRMVEQLLNNSINAGNYDIEWNAVNHPSGTYLIKFNASSFQEIRKCLLLK